MNTRQLDRIITAAERKLQGIQQRETWALTPKEQAKLAGLGTVVVGKGTRQKSSPRAERGMAQIWAEAEARLRAEITAAQSAKQAAVNEAAAAKVAKKAKGWW